MRSESHLRCVKAGAELVLKYQFRLLEEIKDPKKRNPTFVVERLTPGEETLAKPNQSAAKKVKLELTKRDATGGTSPVTVEKDTRTSIDAGLPDSTDGLHFWQWDLTITTPSNTGSLEIEARLDSTNAGEVKKLRKDEFILGVELAKVSPTAQVDEQLRVANPPRVILGVNATPVPDPVNVVGHNKPDDLSKLKFDAPGATEVRAILRYVWTRLKTNLDAVWLSQDKRKGFVPLEDLKAADFAGDANELKVYQDEEQWARTHSELIAGFPYAGIGQAYLSNDSDNPFFDKMQDKDDPAYPLVAACQHLCTFMAITRGFPVTHPVTDAKGKTTIKTEAYDASRGSKSVVEFFGGTWDDGGTRIPKKDLDDHKLSPGSVYAYDNDDTKNPSRHIAFVLRTDKLHAWIQFFDTGAMNAPGGDEPLKGGTGIYDYPLWEKDQAPGPAPPKAPIATAKFKGLGVIPTPGNQLNAAKTPDLVAAVKHIRRARPLGLVRLVLTTLKDGKLLYATPLLRMHTVKTDPEAPDTNFSFMRYVWSLRELPGKDHIKATWEIDIPRLALARLFLKFPRLTSVETYAEAIADKTKPKKRGQDLLANLQPHVDFVSKPSGQVEAVFRNFSIKKSETESAKVSQRPKLPSEASYNRPSSQVLDAAGVDSVQTNIPEYLRGDFKLLVDATDEMLKITLLDADQKPRPHVPYVLVIYGGTRKGESDDNGVIVEVNPAFGVPLETKAELTIDGQQYQIQIADLPRLDPPADDKEQIKGVQVRLFNLGYVVGPAATGVLDAATRKAIKKFQGDAKLSQVNGEMTQEMKIKLKELYGH
ncbi:MAG TPA: peptidoglycan-binding domain-containing protein [Myxococcota bacterium]|jgi:hypothetical protein|nr:peptidoglycan-binding domain-containing protein [Myxococcota bacterium]